MKGISNREVSFLSSQGSDPNVSRLEVFKLNTFNSGGRMDVNDRKRFYKSLAWQVTRKKVLERDNYECQHCKLNGRVTINEHKPDKHKVLDVDHIKSLEHYPHLAFDMDNLQTLCVKCHNAKEGRFVKWQRKPSKWDGDEYW